MKPSAFVDTNIILDLLMNRVPFVTEAAQLFAKAYYGDVRLYVSALSFANAHYQLHKNIDFRHQATDLLRRFEPLVTTLAFDVKIIRLGFQSDFKDFEDGLQYLTCIKNKIPVLLTRNLSDFKMATIPVMTAGDFLKTL